MEHYRAQILLIRAVTALCSLGAVQSDDVRSEVLDEASWGLQVWMDAPAVERLSKLRTWCDGAVATVGRMDTGEKAFLQAQLALLRLRASLPVPQQSPPIPRATKIRIQKKEKPKKVPKGQVALLETIRSRGPIRSRDLITLLAGSLSARTVKRSLKDLANTGLVRRTTGDDGVRYEAIAENA